MNTDELVNVEEMIDSLTGYDEIAIEKHFNGVDFFDLTGIKTVRALVFVLLRRDGLDDKDAKKRVLEMTIGECNARFATDDETNPEDPVTEAGKDD